MSIPATASATAATAGKAPPGKLVLKTTTPTTNCDIYDISKNSDVLDGSANNQRSAAGQEVPCLATNASGLAEPTVSGDQEDLTIYNNFLISAERSATPATASTIPTT